MANPSCDGFLCGSIIKKNSISADRIEYDSLVEIIKDILIDQSTESWLQEVINNILQNSVDSDWLRNFFKDLFEKYVNEDWFKDLICGMGCVGEMEVFDVIPTDITFEATGGTATVQVVVDEGTAWTLTL